jgi:hypothetical protein
MKREDLARMALAAVLAGSAGVHAQLRTGSGFAVSDATHIVTNAHVVEQCRSVRVLLGTRAEPARVLAADAQADLALLQANLAMPRLALRGAPALRLGESVIAFGFPLTGSLSQEGNVTTGNVSALAGLRDDPAYLQMTAPVQPGNSGGPLLDDAGNVIGVITAKLDAVAMAKRTGDIPQNVNFAVKASVLEDFLQRHKVVYAKQVTDRRLSVADVAEAAKAASVRIECSASGQITAQGPARPSQAEPAPAPDAATPLPPSSGPPPALSECGTRQDRASGARDRGEHTLPDHLAGLACAHRDQCVVRQPVQADHRMDEPRGGELPGGRRGLCREAGSAAVAQAGRVREDDGDVPARRALVLRDRRDAGAGCGCTGTGRAACRGTAERERSTPGKRPRPGVARASGDTVTMLAVITPMDRRTTGVELRRRAMRGGGGLVRYSGR